MWAMADQGVASLGNFSTQILLARHLNQATYGIFALLYGIIIFANTLHAGLVTYPLAVRGAAADEEGLRTLAGESLYSTLLLSLPLVALLVVAAKVMGQIRTAPWAIACLVLWQLQEVPRRALMAHLRHRAAVTGDVVSYLGQVGLLWVLASRNQLAIDSAFGAIAVTSAAAAALQLVQVRVRFSLCRRAAGLIRHAWEVGCWAFLANVANGCAYQIFPWGLALYQGPAAAAVFQAITNPLGASRPVMTALGNLVVPDVARARAAQGRNAAWSASLKHAAGGALLIMPYFCLLFLWPSFWLKILYGSHSNYISYRAPLRVLVVGFVLLYITNFLGAVFYGLEQSLTVFKSQLAAAVAAIAIGVPLIIWFGVSGAAIAFTVCCLVQFLAFLAPLRKERPSGYLGVQTLPR